MSQVSKPCLYLRVSILSHIVICGKRSKTETFSKNRGTLPYGNKSVQKGTKLHGQYGYYKTDFERERLIHNLDRYKIKDAFQKTIELPEVIVVVRGKYDDVRVLTSKIGKLCSFIEVKTTSKKYMWSLEVKAAIKQLQIYLWLLKELCELIGYPQWKRHYLEVFSQVTGRLMRRITVEYDENIEEWIKRAVYQYLGLAPMNIAPYAYCKLCPKYVKEDCPYYYMRKES